MRCQSQNLCCKLIDIYRLKNYDRLKPLNGSESASMNYETNQITVLEL